MNLHDAKIGKEYIVKEIFGCCKAKRRLCDMGITPETKIKVLAHTCAFIIEVRGSKLAIGNGLASRIEIE